MAFRYEETVRIFMVNVVKRSFPSDEHFTESFFVAHQVKLSVDLMSEYVRSDTDMALDAPSFFFWEQDEALYLVDFMDGFSVPLAGALPTALELLECSGIKTKGKVVYWRDEDRRWHDFRPAQRKTSSFVGNDSFVPSLVAVS